MIRGNKNFGVLAFENPNPFPVTRRTIFFQASGNAFLHNRFSANGTDIGLEGGLFGTKRSTNNCFAQNTFTTSVPAAIEGRWGCQNDTTPNGDAGLAGRILTMLDETSKRHAQGQPRPRRQPTMPHPCRGVPRNPLCG